MKKILIAVDIQKDFVDGSLGTSEAQAMLPNAVNKIQNHNGPIIVTYDTHSEDYLSTPEGKKLPVKHCIKGTDGWKLDPHIEFALKSKNFTAVEKPTFGSVNLPQKVLELSGGDEFEIELIGLCTDICVVSNALLLKAHFPDVKISVVSDCCAGVTKELHENALAVMRSCQIDIV